MDKGEPTDEVPQQGKTTLSKPRTILTEHVHLPGYISCICVFELPI